VKGGHYDFPVSHRLNADAGHRGSAIALAQVSGAIYTTDSAGGVNINFFTSKDVVYLNGGPAHPGAAGLPDGLYFCKVTQPDGTLLGISDLVTAPITVTGGEFDIPYKLVDILYKASNLAVKGFDTSSNGVYKVWASKDPTFPGSASKTDNFKVAEEGGGGDTDTATLHVIKFYDANANGVNDDGIELTGWKVHIVDGSTLTVIRRSR